MNIRYFVGQNQVFLFSDRDREVDDIEEVSSLSSEVSSTTGLEEN